MRTCTRKIEFDSAHRVMRHESKCRHLHGHRYVAEITAASPELDDLGRVIDFSVLKRVVGGWVDDAWDHGTLANEDDHDLIALCRDSEWKVYTMPFNPTAENIAAGLFRMANTLLESTGVVVTHVRIYETPNCWADYGGPSDED
jgi:6-pyruvoyltetrahydropterin/6-carboxytetrahydropterin synthase